MKDSYIENSVKTASPAKLVEMLYEKGIEVLKDAKGFFKENNFIAANEKIKRAQDIITELNISLDMEKGGEIAKSLRSLYNYMYRTLIESNLKKDIQKLDEVIYYFEQLLDVWKTAMKSTTVKPNENDHHLNISI
ncbi:MULTISPECIES: flagellar export chaperone FliS [Pseudothermotoga]|jgi:flagellar protein FliS|uniref:Flagellar secretion chaperone FliS n=1 Tax=Pseudothermotoga lettingae (strain ATCC BAA-301 / DSM 14385 / NBRC 107922 / TMO) TaxID=416591 RepID=A8F8R4_PSELT|nr:MULTISPECIES: flagellar export chaperone FliS [Pseudothermotoga]ABV34548.1 flagellar protein FliS [Pseudothermotoga lettingae TMO]KUK21880.1 MAG: Flagellar protein FliS [Pseudothermotoga lettingae]MDI3494552.1 flagellar secretion chaperone FliS [Pseudothermotoga sp.]MDK2883507.1 flagellar secretion chaperone FliS [Pseudothermotoga sp.]GLI48506.1 flagellar protein FliS [Pseudothermotoga lettingae TMO]